MNTLKIYAVIGILFISAHFVLSLIMIFTKRWSSLSEILLAIINPFYFMWKGFSILTFMPNFNSELTWRKYIKKLFGSRK
jgi:hypothetical protein